MQLPKAEIQVLYDGLAEKLKQTKEGKTIDYKVEQGIGGGCDEEALRVVKLIPNNWIAAVKDNQYVSSKYTFPVSFTMR